MKIAVLGAGAFGTALGKVLTGNGHTVDYYDPKIEGKTLNEVIVEAEAIVLAVPSKFLPEFLVFLPKDKPLIIATKGILTDEMFKEFENWAVLSGPGFADDIKAGKQTILTATSYDVIELFKTGYLDFDFTTDKKGVLMCGALKNIYAILAGILGLKPNTQEHEEFLATATKEMANVLAANGAEPETVKLACGKGDLRITCDYPSRNYEFGQKLRDDMNLVPEKTVEGVSALRKIRQDEILVPEDALMLKDIIKRSEAWN